VIEFDIQHLAIYWFGYVIVHPNSNTTFLIADHCQSGDSNNRGVSITQRFKSTYGLCRFEAVHFWHLAVHQNYVIGAVLNSLHCSFTAINNVHLQPQLLQ